MALPQMADAARPWMLPSETMFAGSGNEWVTVDDAISRDLYYFEHPGQDWQHIATAPDGSAAQVENRAIGQLRQTFDLGIKKKGTYKIDIFTEILHINRETR